MILDCLYKNLNLEQGLHKIWPKLTIFTHMKVFALFGQ
jgi:hypothetical protein